jgi:hypothetical protein
MARWHRRCGRFVVLDRYREMRRLGEGVSWRRRLRDFVEARTCPRPDLVLMLESPDANARASEPEHGASELEERSPRDPGLSPRGPEVAWLDPTQDPQLVLREALTCIWRGVLRRRRGEAIP